MCRADQGRPGRRLTGRCARRLPGRTMAVMTAADVSSQRIDIPQPGRYRISPAHSTVTIRTRHLFGLGPVRALIDLRDGRIVVADPPEASAVQARFAAASFRSGNETRDAAVLSPRLLHAEAYPSLSFTSTRLLQDHGQWSLRGELEVRGVTRLVEARITALRPATPADAQRERPGRHRPLRLRHHRLPRPRRAQAHHRPRHRRPPGAVMTRTGASRLRSPACASGTARRSRSTTSACASARARSSASSARTARARPPPSSAPRGCATPTAARSGCSASTPTATAPRHGSWSASSSRRASCPTRSPSPRRSTCTRPSTPGTPTPRRSSLALA